jgi:hypothetical protein
MKDPASLHNEWLHRQLMELHDALISITAEDTITLRRAWRTLPRREDHDGFVETPDMIRKIILDLLVEVKEEIEAAAAGAVK